MQQTVLERLFFKLTSVTEFVSDIDDQLNQRQSQQFGRIWTTKTDINTLIIKHIGHHSTEKQLIKVEKQHCWHINTQQRLCLNSFAYARADEIIFTANNTTYHGAPYACGHDTYLATLITTDDMITLNWQITGPNKDIHIATQYF